MSLTTFALQRSVTRLPVHRLASQPIARTLTRIALQKHASPVLWLPRRLLSQHQEPPTMTEARQIGALLASQSQSMKPFEKEWVDSIQLTPSSRWKSTKDFAWQSMLASLFTDPAYDKSISRAGMSPARQSRLFQELDRVALAVFRLAPTEPNRALTVELAERNGQEIGQQIVNHANALEQPKRDRWLRAIERSLLRKRYYLTPRWKRQLPRWAALLAVGSIADAFCGPYVLFASLLPWAPLLLLSVLAFCALRVLDPIGLGFLLASAFAPLPTMGWLFIVALLCCTIGLFRLEWEEKHQSRAVRPYRRRFMSRERE